MSNQFITEFTLTDASKKFLAMEPTLIKDMSDYIGVNYMSIPCLEIHVTLSQSSTAVTTKDACI